MKRSGIQFVLPNPKRRPPAHASANSKGAELHPPDPQTSVSQGTSQKPQTYTMQQSCKVHTTSTVQPLTKLPPVSGQVSLTSYNTIGTQNSSEFHAPKVSIQPQQRTSTSKPTIKPTIHIVPNLATHKPSTLRQTTLSFVPPKPAASQSSTKHEEKTTYLLEDTHTALSIREVESKTQHHPKNIRTPFLCSKTALQQIFTLRTLEDVFEHSSLQKIKTMIQWVQTKHSPDLYMRKSRAWLMVVSGPVGSGKTEYVRLVLKLAGYQAQWFRDPNDWKPRQGTASITDILNSALQTIIPGSKGSALVIDASLGTKGSEKDTRMVTFPESGFQLIAKYARAYRNLKETDTNKPNPKKKSRAKKKPSRPSSDINVSLLHPIIVILDDIHQSKAIASLIQTSKNTFEHISLSPLTPYLSSMGPDQPMIRLVNRVCTTLGREFVQPRSMVYENLNYCYGNMWALINTIEYLLSEDNYHPRSARVLSAPDQIPPALFWELCRTILDNAQDMDWNLHLWNPYTSTLFYQTLPSSAAQREGSLEDLSVFLNQYSYADVYESKIIYEDIEQQDFESSLSKMLYHQFTRAYAAHIGGSSRSYRFTYPSIPTTGLWKSKWAEIVRQALPEYTSSLQETVLERYTHPNFTFRSGAWCCINPQDQKEDTETKLSKSLRHSQATCAPIEELTEETVDMEDEEPCEKEDEDEVIDCDEE